MSRSYRPDFTVLRSGESEYDGARSLCIDAAARSVGRAPTEIRRVIQLVGQVTDRVTTTGRPRRGPGTQPIRTTPDGWANIITEFVVQERFDP